MGASVYEKVTDGMHPHLVCHVLSARSMKKKEDTMSNEKVQIVENILDANDQLAAQNRSLLDQAGVFAVNLMASPGAGKTSLILETIRYLKGEMKIGVIEGDTAPLTIDADKVIDVGMPAIQINTGGECHLDANMLRDGIKSIDLAELDLLIVENVGNLIYPAAFKLGTHANVLIASVPEGDDKPYKPWGEWLKQKISNGNRYLDV